MEEIGTKRSFVRRNSLSLKGTFKPALFTVFPYFNYERNIARNHHKMDILMK